MEDDNQALNVPATEAEVTTPVTETEAPEVNREETADVATEAESEQVAEEGSRKTATTRIRELNAKAKAAEERAQSLAQKVAELTGSVDSNTETQPYVPYSEAGDEISPEQYRADVANAADAIVQLRMKQKETLDRVNSESMQAIKDYPQLDPSHEEFDKELSESISTATLALISRTPTASVKKFVSSLMKPYMRSVEKGVGKAQSEMAKQVTQAALRPTTVQAKEKTSSEMTLKELEDKLGVVY